MANPTTNYGFVLPTPTDLVTDLPADFDVALQGVDTRLKALQPGTTLGDLAYSSATANTNTRLAIGSTGNVLTVAGGVPTWAAPSAPSSGFNLIKRATTSGAVNTGTTFDNVFTSTYKTYLIFIETWTSATSTDDARFQFRYSATTQATDYYGGSLEIARNGSQAHIANAGTTVFTMTNDLGTSAQAGSAFTMTINKVGNSSQTAMGYFQGIGQNAQSNINGAILVDLARTYDGFILSSTGNIAVTAAVYGLATA